MILDLFCVVLLISIVAVDVTSAVHHIQLNFVGRRKYHNYFHSVVTGMIVVGDKQNGR